MQSLAARKPAYSLSDFPTLNVTYDELEKITVNTLPQLAIDMDNVQDILPLAPFQKLAADGNSYNPPRHWNFLLFELPASTNTDRLYRACQSVVDRSEILRTVFVRNSGGTLLQVIFKTLHVQIHSFASSKDIAEASDEFYEQDFVKPRYLGQSFLRFTLLEASDAKRLILRLSHAQFDGYSCDAIVAAFAASYSEKPPPHMSGYSDIIRHTLKQNRKSYQYWRLLLGEAQLTRVPQIVQQDVYNKENSVIRVNKTIPHFEYSSETTAAATFTAACALLLSSLTGSSDLLFSRLVSGRAALDNDLINVVGPCINLMPIRVQLSVDQKLSDMLKDIQNRSIESSMHETVGLDELVQHCTQGWAKETYFPVITQYQNVYTTPKAKSEDVPFELSVHDSTLIHPFPESLCIAGFPSKDGVIISVSAGSGCCDREIIASISKELCAILGRVSTELKKEAT